MRCDLSGETAFVTGAAGGFGEGIVREFLKNGANVVIADLDADGAKALAEDVDPRGERTLALALDVADSKGVRTAFDRTLEKFKTVEILVNSAGITKRMPFLDFPEETFDKIIEVNLKGTFLCAQAAAKIMVQKKYGKIINFTSVGGVAGLPNTVAYCASKGGVTNMTRGMAIDLAEHNISVNAIAPCSADTKISKTVYSNPEELKWFMSRIPLGRKCEVSDISNATLFLAARESDFITGHILHVDGGWLAI
jgi:NAD(P)-dependent dehydrogenase (short-subunit alcohol dehydrogenase family)